MSYAAMLILSSPTVASQTRCSLSPAVGAKECLRCCAEVDKGHHQPSTSLNLKAVVRFLSDGSSKANRSVATKAGLGRYSGAIHGNSKGKSRSRRKPPVQNDERCDEHQESSGGDGDTLTPERPGKDGESSAEEDAACEAFATAEGVIAQGASSDDAAQQLSYNRYLLELGVSPRPLSGDSEAEHNSSEPLLIHHGMVDGSPTDQKDLQSSDEHQLPDNGVFSQAGSEAGQVGDQGDEAKEDLKIRRTNEAEGKGGKVAEKLDFVVENEPESENGSYVDKSSSIGSPVFDHVLKPSLSTEAEDKGSGSGEQATDRISDTENVVEHRSVSDAEPIKKKRKRKLNSKAAVDFSVKPEDRDDKERVRASSGGAERPATLPEERLEKSPAMHGSVTAFVMDGEIFEPKADLGTDEVPENELQIQSRSAFSLVADTADLHTQSPVLLDGAVVSDSVTDASNEESSALALSVESTPLSVLGKVGSQVVETVLEQAVQTAVKVVPLEVVEQAAQVASKVVELPAVVVEQAAQVGGQVVEILPDVVTEQVGQVVDHVVDQVSEFAEQVSQEVSQVVDHVSDVAEQVSLEVSQVVDHVSDVAEQVANTVNEQVEFVTETVSNTASQVAEQVTNGVDTVTSTASQVVDQVTEFFSSDDEEGSDSDDEFEAYITSDLPEFRGRQGLSNFIVKQEDQGVLSKIYDLYTYMLKQSFPKFATAMFCTPILVSAFFTLLYLPEFNGLAFDETARDFFAPAGGDSLTLQLSLGTIFQVFMFSLSLSTGLQPDLTPLSPYTLVVANLNALVAQLVFVFLSGAVFARLSQPSQPLRCSEVALVSSPPAQRRRKESSIKVFMARYVLAGPQPCELVDVKVDLTYKYNTLTRTGSFFRATQSLKLVRPEIAFLTHGMLVRHVIDETSPLHLRTPEMLNKEDAVFCLSVVGLERASMQSVFHVQHYCVVDNDLVWDAEFEDIILINKKNRRVVDHSRLSMWRPVVDVHH